MRFKPGTTQAQMQAAMEALANRPKTRGAAGIGGTRPYGGSMNLGTAAGPGGGRPGMGVPPSSQVNPTQPNVMGFPDMPNRSVGVPGTPTYREMYPSGGRPANPFTVDRMPTQPGMQPRSPNPFTVDAMPRGPNTALPNVTGFPDTPPMRGSLPPIPTSPPPGVPGGAGLITTTGTPSVGTTPGPMATAAPAFKKGGMVKPKAPVKKAAGGKVAAKAPVKKAMGGPIKAKPAAKPAAKMAKPMPAMKRGGKVMAKGRKK